MTVMPILAVEPVVLPVLAPVHRELWSVLGDLADGHPGDWVLVGGQMVLLHALEARRSPPRVSQDLDTIIDARVRPLAVASFLATLTRLDSRAVGASPARTDNVPRSQVSIETAGGVERDNPKFFTDRYAESYAADRSRFVDVVEGSARPNPTGIDGYRALLLAEAAYLSLAERRQVTVEETEARVLGGAS
jgi:hypothetical protein